MPENNKKLVTYYGLYGVGGNTSSPNPSPIDPKDLGSISLYPNGEFEAGSYQTFELTYTAGKFGIDDSGSIRICFRFASDQSKPQFEDKKGVNYTSIIASNNAVLNYHFDNKGNVRPWDKTLYIKVVKGFLKEGDNIKIKFGDKSFGSPGMRLQTFCEDTYEFHTLVDPIATYCYQPMLKQPTIKIVPGSPHRYIAIIPSLIKCGEKFSLKIKGEDIWGNPSDKCNVDFFLNPSIPVKNLPKKISLKSGSFSKIIDKLQVDHDKELFINFCDNDGNIKFRSNLLKVESNPDYKLFWGDLHGQSEETIGTGSAEQYFLFARDCAFLDVTSHQGNDFQMTKEFWETLNKLSSKYTVDNEFVIIPGYEWSGNTALGGDRNVFFPNEGRIIRRSSHAMISDQTDIENDCHTATDLFEAFAKNNEFDVLGYAHCGGRYADINFAHDSRFEKSMEVHSSWGTFEWLVHDAFKLGLRTGIVANSDGHKGRPGASYPGASQFGAIGGLTCFLSKSLNRQEILKCIRNRHHYASSGGPNGRPVINLNATFSNEGILYHDDPRYIKNTGEKTNHALMGDIVKLSSGEMKISVEIFTSSSIERVEIFNGLELEETIKPYKKENIGKKIKLLWEGAEYRGRFREVIWDGKLNINGNSILEVNPINFFNIDKNIIFKNSHELEWKALTTGNFGGLEILLENHMGGILNINTPLINQKIDINEIQFDDLKIENNGNLPRFVRFFRIPEFNTFKNLKFERNVKLKENGDNPIFIKLIQEDGTVAWTSPIYVFRK